MEWNFDQMVERIVKEAGIPRDEALRRIHEKQMELDGFVTPEGAANIVARELGIVFERPVPETRALRLHDLVPGMSRVDVTARVQRVLEPKEFQRPDGSKSAVGGLILYDGTAQVRLTLWGDKARALEEIKKGDLVKITNGYVREGLDGRPELSLGSRGSLQLNPEDPEAASIPPLPEGPVRISEIRPELAEVDVVGRITGISGPRRFERADGSTGEVSTIFLSDGTGVIRVSLWGELARHAERLKKGDAVRLENAAVREGLGKRAELSLDARGRLVLNPPEASSLPQVPGRVLKIKEIEPEMPSIDVLGVVRRKLPQVEFRRSDGSPGRVASIIIADDTGTVRVSFWGKNAEIVEGLKPGDVLMIRNAYSRTGLGGRPELHIGMATAVEINPPGLSVGELKPSPVKIAELEPNMESLEIIGRVVDVHGVREFHRPDGTSGKVMGLTIGDETGLVRVSLWHAHADEASDVRAGDILKLVDCYTVAGMFDPVEVHLGKTGTLIKNPPGVELPPVELLRNLERRVRRMSIGEIGQEGGRVQVRGTVVQVFRRRPVFDVCPNCGRSLGTVDSSMMCGECGKVVTPEHRPVISLLLDDGTDTIRVVMFGKTVENFLGMDQGRIFEMYRSASSLDEFYNGLGLVGRELVVSGTVRMDRYLNQLELRAFGVRVADPREETRMIIQGLKEEMRKL